MTRKNSNIGAFFFGKKVGVDITEEWFTPFMKRHFPPQPKPEKRLCVTLLPKTKYVVHLATLQLYVHLGLKVTRIHRVLTFKQSNFLRDFFLFNQRRRMQAILDDDSFLSMLIKILLNASWGKSCQDARKFTNLRVVSTYEGAIRALSQPNFKSVKVIKPDMVFFVFTPREVCLRSPVYLGFTTLEISKLVLYSFFYLNVRKLWPSSRYLYGDTDSVLLSVHGVDIEAELGRLSCFDGSNLPKEHPLYSTSAAGQPLHWKMETGGASVSEACMARPKVYQLKMVKEMLCYVDEETGAVTPVEDGEEDEIDPAVCFKQRMLDYKNVCRGVPKAYSARFTDQDYTKALLRHESTSQPFRFELTL